MIHPSTKLAYLSDDIGYGVVATATIPVGTIVYVKDALEIVIDKQHALLRDPHYRDVIEKYSYTEADDCRVLSWDIAKYVNHSCASNTLSTGYGFEIAVRDIQTGEQITDDYGMLNIERQMACLCGEHHCRHVIGVNDFHHHAKHWDARVKSALAKLPDVEQPLAHYLDHETRQSLEKYLDQKETYISVLKLQRPSARKHEQLESFDLSEIVQLANQPV